MDMKLGGLSKEKNCKLQYLLHIYSSNKVSGIERSCRRYVSNSRRQKLLIALNRGGLSWYIEDDPGR